MTAAEQMEIARLAALDTIDYAHERKAAAKQPGISVTALDKLGGVARSSLNPSAPSGKPLVLTDIGPWPTVVEGTELVDELIKAFTTYVVTDEANKLTAALWALHCHTIDATSITPRPAVTSTFPESGKSTLLKVLRHLIPRPRHLVALKGPTFFGTMNAGIRACCWTSATIGF
jgi:hypothetical protein